MTSFFIPRGLRVREADANPSVIASELVFTNGSLSVAGSVVTVQSSGVTDGDKGDITVSASGATWTIDNDAPSIANKVVGPASSTDNAVARFDATTGKLIQDSSVVVTDDGFVGIGTNSPDKKLVIDGSTGSPGLSVRHTARSGSGLDISSGNNRSSIFNSDALPLRLGVSSTTAINISSTNEVTFPVGVALGTPLSGVATNLTGTASGLTAGNVTTNANLTGHVTSVGNAAVLGSFTKAQLDAAVSDGNVLYVGDITSNATHTGDVTGATALTIADSAVTLAKMANLAQDQFIGRTTASTGVPETATITAAARTVLDDATVAAMVDTLGGATATGTGGLVRATSPTLSGTLTASGTISTPTLNIVNGANSATATYSQPFFGKLSYAIQPSNSVAEVEFFSKGSSGGNGTINFNLATSESANGGNNLNFSARSTKVFLCNALNYTAGGPLELGGKPWGETGLLVLSGTTNGGDGLAAVNGKLTASGTATATAFYVAGTAGLVQSNVTRLGIRSQSSYVAHLVDNAMLLGSPTSLGWVLSGDPSSENAALILSQQSAGVLQIGTTAKNALGSLLLTNLTASGTVTLGSYTVGTLPSAAANTRATAYVTDSNVASFGAVATAGGSLGVTVFSNGTNWIVSGGTTQPQKAITSGTAAPSGGVDGDIYLQYV